METIIKIEGMSCGHCVKAVTDAVSDVPGVSSAVVDLEAKTATVNYDSEIVSLDTIKTAIDDQGFDVVD